MHAGGCACGAVRLRCTAPPLHASYCHCADCRRQTGAPVTVFVGFDPAAVHFESAPRTRHCAPHVRRGFCPACGSPMAYADDRLADAIYLLAGVFDDPGFIRPQCHAWTREALAWLDIADGLPRYPGFSRPRPGSG